MKIEIGSRLTISEAPLGALQWIMAGSTFPNPEYENKAKMGLYTNYLEKEIKIYKEVSPGVLEAPRGLLRFIYDRYVKLPEGLVVDDKRICPKTEGFNLNPAMDMRDYQGLAKETAFKRAQGMVVAPAGSGKTVIGIAIAQRTKTKVLWLTHKIELLEQTRQRFMEWTDLKEEDICVVGDGEVGDLNAKVIIATIQTLNNWSGVTDILEGSNFDILTKSIGCVIIDEAHHAAATSWHIIERFPALYRIGLTATHYRSDSLSHMLTAIIGIMTYEVERNMLVQDNSIVKCMVKVIPTKSNYEGLTNDDNRYHQLMCADMERNNMIANLVTNTIEQHKCMLVLTSRIAHCEHLSELIRVRLQGKGITDTPVHAFSSQGKFKFDNTLKKCVLVATYGKATEGLDMPQLDAIVYAQPCKAAGRVEQTMGRIERPNDGKKTPIVYDIYDKLMPLAKGKYKERKVIYDQRGIVIDDREENTEWAYGLQ